MSAMRLAIAEAQALDNSYKASDNRDKIKDVLLSTIQADTTALEKDGWSAANDTTANAFKITYSGDDYKQACNDDNAEIVYTITLGQKSIEITNETNATLKDQGGNDVDIDIGGAPQDMSKLYAPGLYSAGAIDLFNEGKANEGYALQVKSWDTLVSEGLIDATTGTFTEQGKTTLEGELIWSPDVTTCSAESATKITAMYFPEGVVRVEYIYMGEATDGWFYGTGLEKVYLPASVRKLDYVLFDFCPAIKELHYNGTIQQFIEAFGASDSDSRIPWPGVFYNSGYIESWDDVDKPILVYCTDGVLDVGRDWT